ncbi:recombinase family protein [Algiphilus sp.]|uniref:recombinase family protein n=1 Tax=Algiphilus sp. TaxID=1872431 RepID=UPI0032EF6D23
MKRAATYLRSSKDRSDVSIDSQRRELAALAADRGIVIVEEFADAVESGKSEHRPAFQRLLHDLKRSDRGWDTILVTDTSRLSRRRYVAQALSHECAKRNVQIVFSKVPEVDPISQVILESVLQAMDEVHSLMSREKGLAGMRENVHRGWRAGGRAPWGYQLAHHDTGTTRDGEPVRKTTLEPNNDAHQARRYLQARAAGSPRAEAMRQCGIDRNPSSMIGIEWNALTYAGHTVWNVHETRAGGGYKGGRKRRPREDWVVQRDTHEALITEPEAEAILSALDTNPHRMRSTSGTYLLSGLLVTPDGKPWTGTSVQRNGATYRYYRAKGKRLPADQVDGAILEQVLGDMRSASFIRALTRETRRAAEQSAGDPAADLRTQLVGINEQIDKLMGMATQMTDPGPALRRADTMEAERKALAEEISRIEAEHSQHAALAHVTEDQVREILDGLAGDHDTLDSGQLRALLRSLLERIEIDPASNECRVSYAIPCADVGANMASPRGFEPLLPP